PAAPGRLLEVLVALLLGQQVAAALVHRLLQQHAGGLRVGEVVARQLQLDFEAAEEFSGRAPVLDRPRRHAQVLAGRAPGEGDESERDGACRERGRTTAHRNLLCFWGANVIQGNTRGKGPEWERIPPRMTRGQA